MWQGGHWNTKKRDPARPLLEGKLLTSPEPKPTALAAAVNAKSGASHWDLWGKSKAGYRNSSGCGEPVGSWLTRPVRCQRVVREPAWADVGFRFLLPRFFVHLIWWPRKATRSVPEKRTRPKSLFSRDKFWNNCPVQPWLYLYAGTCQ